MTGMDVLSLNTSDSGQHKTAIAHPYSSAGSSASSSSSSIFSLDSLSSQTSISSSTTAADVIWENEASGELSSRGLSHSENVSHYVRASLKGCPTKASDAPVHPEMRKHPRRTGGSAVLSNGTSACHRAPPHLVRQCDRKNSFVDNLVDSASQIVETIWPLSVVALRSESSLSCKGVLPLRNFIQETLRRSRTSYSTLQVALYYLIKIRPHVPNHDFTMEQPRDKPCPRAMQCGRRMFLAALILASKYLQDRNYSARAWSKISGLKICEINQNEMMFLQAVNWKLHVPEATYHRWTDIVLKYTPTPATSHCPEECWRTVIPKLTPELDTIDVDPSSPRDRLGSLVDVPSPGRSAWEGSVSSGTPNEPTSCPRSIPLALEPTRMDNPNPTLPTLHKLGLLPTPQLTPQSSAASTPAVSASGFCSRRPSIGTAMSHAQSMCMARFALDPRPCNKPTNVDGFPTLTRRSSLARSTSSTSSPESMISDISTFSSRSSRSSSISSCASATCAPVRPRMAVTATRRCAAKSLKDNRKNLSIQSPIDEISMAGVYQSPEPDTDNGCGSVPDFSNFSLHTPVDMTAHEAAQGLCELSGAMPLQQTTPQKMEEGKRCRKRGRTTSEDQMLQNNVRELINTDHAQRKVLPDSQIANSFLLPGAQNLHGTVDCPLGSIKLPVPIGGIKRACCSAEARSRAVPTPKGVYMEQ